MEIKIWSDIRCPFCYIGKRKFEKALDRFSHKDDVKVIWKSFELDPDLATNTTLNAAEHLSQVKGISKTEAEGMQKYVANIAKEIGIHFNSDESVVANSFNAHRLIQFAKSQNRADDVEEALFRAHFVEGKNIDDVPTLITIGVAAGLDKDKLENMYRSEDFKKEVRNDETEAANLGINGVPFFVFNNKYAVSGAQSPDTFLQVLEQSWKEFEEERSPLIVTEGPSCAPDGKCN
jgi:predicted DsbA family dithiol-disulfide isomerase